MSKRALLTSVLFSSFALLLAACGGSGGGGPLPNPPPPKPTVYTASLVFVGTMAKRQIQGELRHSISPMATATQPPIMILSPGDANGCVGYVCSGTSEQGVVQAVVSPQPSTQPTVSFSQTDPHAWIQPTTPPASPAPLPTGVVGENGVGTDGSVNVQSAGTATADVGSPVNSTATTNIYQYVGIGIDCIPSTSFGVVTPSSSPGWTYDSANHVWNPTSDPNTADIYCTGSKAVGNYAVAGDPGTLNMPGGCTPISTDTVYATLATSQRVSPITSATFSSLMVQNGDGSYNTELVCLTRDGLTAFKLFPNSVASGGGYGEYDGAVEVAGNGIDGFQ